MIRRTTYRITNVRPATAGEIAATARINELLAQQLTTVRAAAQDWRNGVGLSTIAAGVISLVKTPEIVKGATSQQISDGGWLLGLGMIAVLVSLSCALRASFGWPKPIEITTEDTLRRWEGREVIVSLAYLRTSMIAAVVALALLATAYGVLIFHVPLPLHFPGWQR